MRCRRAKAEREFGSSVIGQRRILSGEAALIAASVYAGATGHLHIAAVIGCAALGAIIGDNIGFWAGRRFGKMLLVKYGPLIHVGETRLKIGEYLFRQHGAKSYFTAGSSHSCASSRPCSQAPTITHGGLS
jgi:membrane protein DedA with SNARE-associated domain